MKADLIRTANEDDNSRDPQRSMKGRSSCSIREHLTRDELNWVVVDASRALIDRGDRDRGEVLFRHTLGAGYLKCHSVDQSTSGFGPNLSTIELRSNSRHIVRSIVEPNAIITEGINQLTVVTDEGLVYSGMLLEESGLTLSLGQSTRERTDISKNAIEERKRSSVSAMPERLDLLTPQHVADITANC